MPLHYTIGDATLPQGAGPKIIAHCCNDAGGWGAGFVVALSKQWGFAEDAYRQWSRIRQAKGVDALYGPGPRCETSGPFQLGEAQFALVGPKLWVANIIGQKGFGLMAEGRPPIRYEAIQQGLRKTCRFAIEKQATVHMPRMGAGLAGGNWTAIEQLVNEELITKGVEVTVYDLPKRSGV